MLRKGHFVRAWSIGLDWRDHNDESTKSAINMQTWFWRLFSPPMKQWGCYGPYQQTLEHVIDRFVYCAQNYFEKRQNKGAGATSAVLVLWRWRTRRTTYKAHKENKRQTKLQLLLKILESVSSIGAIRFSATSERREIKQNKPWQNQHLYLYHNLHFVTIFIFFDFIFVIA